MSERNFFSELKRRNVYKVAVAYAVVACLLVQAASIVLPTFEAPAWTMKVLIAALAIGSPVAISFAWAFEITPEGIKLEKDVEPGQSITHQTGRKLIAMTVVVAVIAAGLFVFQFLRARSTSTPRQDATAARTEAAAIPAKSIAVLPFENLSRDPDNAYFADGIQDEILTRLSKIADLKVISRTSTKKYKSAPDNSREIGKQLGVANLVEGSVQKIANGVHVNVQLIRALTNIFGRRVMIASSMTSSPSKVKWPARFADALNAKLSGAEKQVITAKPTNNPEAYDAYLRGLALYRKGDPDSNQKVESLLEQAVRLDPAFGISWALLARVNAEECFTGDERPKNVARRRARRWIRRCACNLTLPKCSSHKVIINTMWSATTTLPPPALRSCWLSGLTTPKVCWRSGLFYAARAIGKRAVLISIAPSHLTRSHQARAA